MTDHPSTYNAAKTHSPGIEWDDRASVHVADDGQGLFDAMKGIHRGSLAEMVALVSALPDEERENLVIQKAGDHRLGPDEIIALSRLKDFPLK